MVYTVAAASSGLSAVSEVVTYFFEVVGNVCTTIVSTPLLLLPVGTMLAFSAVALAKQFIGR